jgi:peptide subunit release factor RF-3
MSQPLITLIHRPTATTKQDAANAKDLVGLNNPGKVRIGDRLANQD